MMYKNKLIALTIGLLMISLVSAAGVSSPYWKNNPLVMAKGETKTINLNLQNMVGNNDIVFNAELVKGSDITSLSKTSYAVQAGTSDTYLPLKVTLPKDIKDGETKTIRVEFTTSSDKETGGVGLTTGFVVEFNVIAEGNAESNVNWILIILTLLALAVLIIILWMIFRKRKSK